MATLILIVILSGFEALARSRGAAEPASAVWLIGVGTIKVRIMGAIVVISAVDLLEIFYDSAHVSTDRIPWLIALHITFVVTAVLLAVIDWLASLTR